MSADSVYFLPGNRQAEGRADEKSTQLSAKQRLPARRASTTCRHREALPRWRAVPHRNPQHGGPAGAGRRARRSRPPGRDDPPRLAGQRHLDADRREIREMCRLGAEAGIEVSLFVGPRAAWGTSAQVRASAGKNLGARLRGMDEVVYATEDIIRGCELGLRSVLVADEGQLWLVNEMKKAGELAADLVVKISVQMGAANPISVKLLEDLGAGTYNTPTDLTLPQLAAIRAAIDIPLDVYVEAPDDFGGFVRHYEVPEMIRVAAPMYVKLGLRNAANIYPSGQHIEDLAVKQSRERVHRTALVMDIIERYAGDAVMGAVGAAALIAIMLLCSVARAQGDTTPSLHGGLGWSFGRPVRCRRYDGRSSYSCQ